MVLCTHICIPIQNGSRIPPLLLSNKSSVALLNYRFTAFFLPFFLLVLIKLVKKKACLARAQGAPWLSCGKGTVMVNRGRSHPRGRRQPHSTHTDQRASMFLGDVKGGAWTEHVWRKHVWDSWRDSGDRGGEGERNSLRWHDACLACFPASHVGAWKGAGRLHPSEKSHHIHSSTWMLFGLMDSCLTQ